MSKLGSGGTVDWTIDQVPHHVDVPSFTIKILPDSSSTVPFTVETIGNREIDPYPGVVTFETIASDDITMNASTGSCTTNDIGGTLTGVVHYDDDGEDIHLTSDEFTVECTLISGGPNEPVGMVGLYSNSFASMSETGWGSGLANFTAVNDLTSPGVPPASFGAANVGLMTMVAYTWQGTAASGSTSTTIVLDSSASAVNGSYVGQLVSNDDNPLHPYRQITAYVGATRTATITGWAGASDPPQPSTWDVVPTNGSASRVHGMTPGSGSAVMEVGGQPISFAPTVFYTCGFFKVNADFQACYDGAVTGSGVNKCFEVGSKHSYYGGIPAVHCPEMTNDSIPKVANGPLAWVGVGVRQPTFPSNTNYGQTGPYASKRLTRGVWYFVETLVRSSTLGNSDGEFKFWLQEWGVDDEPLLIIDATDRYETPIGYLTRWTYFNLQNTYGGGGNPITTNNEYRHANRYVSGGFNDPDEEPTAWALTSYNGTSVAAGAKINIVAQLQDALGRPVNTFGPTPTSYSATNGGTLTGLMDWPVTFDTGTGSGPASGEVRFNNADMSLVTHIYMSAFDRNGRSMAALANLITVDATLRFSSESNSDRWDALVTAITTGGSGGSAYYDFTVSNTSALVSEVNSTAVPPDGKSLQLFASLILGRNAVYVTIPGGLTTGQTVVVTCSDSALKDNMTQVYRTRGSNSLTLTVL